VRVPNPLRQRAQVEVGRPASGVEFAQAEVDRIGSVVDRRKERIGATRRGEQLDTLMNPVVQRFPFASWQSGQPRTAHGIL